MSVRHADAIATALLTLRGGVLRYGDDGWWALGDAYAQRIPSAVVDRLRAERLVEASGGSGATPDLRLSPRGERAAAEAAAARAAAERAWSLIEPLRTGPLLTLRPADGSEDADHLLVLRVDEAEAEGHRRRLARARSAAEDDAAGAFDFSQYRTDVWKVPIHDAAVRLGLLPGDDPPCRLIPDGIEAPDALGALRCPDRGINYGATTVTVFGGLGPEDPLTVSPAIDADLFAAFLPDLGEGSGRGPLRTIHGFHRDDEGHWVAELSCGHGRHVRDDPPWVERPWVRTEEGRRSRRGAPLRCARCEDGEPAPGGPEAPG